MQQHPLHVSLYTCDFRLLSKDDFRFDKRVLKFFIVIMIWISNTFNLLANVWFSLYWTKNSGFISFLLTFYCFEMFFIFWVFCCKIFLWPFPVTTFSNVSLTILQDHSCGFSAQTWFSLRDISKDCQHWFYFQHPWITIIVCCKGI